MKECVQTSDKERGKEDSTKGWHISYLDDLRVFSWRRLVVN